MVKELYVEEPKKQLDWDTETQYLYELTMEGVPLPEDYEEVLRERALVVGHEGDQTPGAVQARAEWDSYHVWLDTDLSTDPRSPRERLEAYFRAKEIEACVS